jgi:hypothetical protein
MPSLVFDKTPDCIVTWVGRSNPTDEDWARYVAFCAAQLAAGVPPRALIVTAGGSPSPAQRRLLDQGTRQAAHHMRAAILTRSTFARGVMNAMALVTPGYRAFSPDRLEEALAYIEVRPSLVAEVRAMLARMEAQVTAVQPHA